MPIASWRRRCSRMGSGKRASMREGPLAGLFRKTETEGLEERPGVAEQPQQADGAEPRPAPQPSETSPTQLRQERRRHAFSAALAGNMMTPPAHEPAQPPEAPPAYYAPPPPEQVGTPQLKVVGVGGAGVNAVNRMIEAEVAG